MRLAPVARHIPAKPGALRLGSAPVVDATLLDYAGAPIANTDVGLYWSATREYGGYGTTNAAGVVQWVALYAPSDMDMTHADLVTILDSGQYLSWFYQDPTAPITLQPGKIAVNVAGLTDPSQLLDVYLYGDIDNGGNTEQFITGTENQALAAPGVVGYANIYLNNFQGIEWTQNPPIGVAAGLLSSSSIDVNVSDAKGLSTLGWASGAPGANAVVALANWPAGQSVKLHGQSAYSKTTADFGSWTSTGALGIKTVKIPATATPGYAYIIDGARKYVAPDWSDFDVYDYYQVATLKPSSSVIRRGSYITMSGIVPVKGHSPTTVGTKKLVYIYARTTAVSKQPASWNGAASHAISGWTLVASMYTDGHGVYKSKLLRPLKTTYYVAYYKGDSWYWPAYTSVTHVTVK
jgi:hypothetical protein